MILERLSLPLSLIFVTIIYALTLSPYCAGGDSGELITTSYLLSVAHPPGYPLYTFLSHFFTLIPWGTTALKVNFFSLVTNILALLFFYLSLKKMGVKTIWGLMALFLLAFSPLFWEYSLIAEVFALNNLFITLTLFMALTYHLTPQNRHLYLYAFTVGLSLTHHHTILFWVVPLTLYLLLKHKLYLQPKKFFFSILFGLIGLLPYLYLIWAASLDPIFTWGETDSWKGFWVHFLRLEYGTFKLTEKNESAPFFYNLWSYCKQLFSETLYVGPLLSLIGMRYAIGQKRPMVLFIFFTFIGYIITFHILANIDFKDNVIHYVILKRFWLYPNILFILWIPFGLHFLSQKLSSMKFGLPLLSSLFLLGPLQVPIHYKSVDQSHNDIMEKYARIKLENLPPKAIYISYGDLDCHILRYLQHAEKVRLDVIILSWAHLGKEWYSKLVRHHYPQITLPNDIYAQSRKPFLGTFEWSVPLEGVKKLKGYSINYFLSANIQNFPIYLTHFKDTPFQTDQSWQESYYFFPIGIVDRALPKGESYNFSEYYEEALRFLPTFEYLKKSKPLREDRWEYTVWNYYWKEYLDTLYHLINLGKFADQKAQNKVAQLIDDFLTQSPYPLPPMMISIKNEWKKPH